MPEITRRALALMAAGAAARPSAAEARPNILWITCEDVGPDLNFCGQKYSVTPRLDELASRSLYYKNAWSNAPVCAPARTTIISGLYPPSTGSEHMRSTAKLPPSFKMFPQYLRQNGYYCTNNSKEDYNLEKPGEVWDESSTRAHWRNRAAGQPFFAVFNNIITHESQIRSRPHRFVHDPAQAPLPAYHPDAPEIRQGWAQYYDNITTMGRQSGELLEDLKRDGLHEDTIVFFYGDHGSGMPGRKRCARNAGLNVSIVLHIPDKYKAVAPPEYAQGASSDRMIGFIDLAPTALSLAGIKPPDHFQGRAFAGQHQAAERLYNFGFRGRMDERYDLVRTVRDKRYVYVRNYMPHKIPGQHVNYMFETPSTRIWKQLFDEGKLNEAQSSFWKIKPAEELYDLLQDRDEVNNLAQSPKHREILARLRGEQQQWAKDIRDIGFLPEGEIHSRAEGSTPWETARSSAHYGLDKILKHAEAASSLQPRDLPALLTGLDDKDSAVRYWSALGFVMRGKLAVDPARKKLHRALDDASPYVRVAAAEALGLHGDGKADLEKALGILLQLASSDRNEHYASLMALNAIDALGSKAAGRRLEIEALVTSDPRVDAKEKTHCQLVKTHILARLQQASKAENGSATLKSN